MNEVVWSDEFSVGIPSLDEQHKRIIHLINKLAANPEISANSEIISNVLGEMLIYTNEHLEFEEQLLQRYGYPDLANHQAKHLVYLEKIGEFSMGIMNHHQDIPKKLLIYLHDWWITHILHEDMQYRPFFENIAIRENKIIK